MRSREQALEAGRRPELIPDGEVWNDTILELAPPPTRGGVASVVWRWSAWDHLVQDYDATKATFGVVADAPHRLDLNFCPAGGKTGSRNRDLLVPADRRPPNPSGLVAVSPEGKTGEKDWLHCNAVAYDAARDEVWISSNVLSEVLCVDHATTAAEAATGDGGRRGRGGDVLYRFGNPRARRRGGEPERQLFCQHSAHVLPGGDADGAARVLLFNNGRAPDRMWSTIDEYEMPARFAIDTACTTDDADADPAPPRLVWRYGPALGRRDSFYCTHSSGCQRLPNGNTLITFGPQGIILEVTRDGEQCWRYVSPVRSDAHAHVAVRQGDQRTGGRFSLFRALRYAPDDPCLAGCELPASDLRRPLER